MTYLLYSKITIIFFFVILHILNEIIFKIFVNDFNKKILSYKLILNKYFFSNEKYN